MARMLLLVAGTAASGKSSSLRNLRNPEKVLYLSSESNKPLPFRDKFKKLQGGLNNPNDVFQLFDMFEKDPNLDTIVIDSITFLMDMFESMNVLTSSNQMSGWSSYQQYFKKIMQEYVAKSQKNWIFLAHNAEELKPNGEMKYYVPVKGALAKNGLEAYFSLVVYARRVPIKELTKLEYDPEILHITPRDEAVGYKHVFQLDVTKDLADSRIRSPLGCFNPNQIFMDNDVQLLLDHLENFYYPEEKE